MGFFILSKGFFFLFILHLVLELMHKSRAASWVSQLFLFEIKIVILMFFLFLCVDKLGQ